MFILYQRLMITDEREHNVQCKRNHRVCTPAVCTVLSAVVSKSLPKMNLGSLIIHVLFLNLSYVKDPHPFCQRIKESKNSLLDSFLRPLSLYCTPCKYFANHSNIFLFLSSRWVSKPWSPFGKITSSCSLPNSFNFSESFLA